GSFEDVAVRVFLQERRGRRELEPEPELEPCVRADALVGLPDLHLALVAEREVRPDVRRRKENSRPMLRSAFAQGEPVLDRRGSVVTRRDDMGVTVDESTIHVPSSTCYVRR